MADEYFAVSALLLTTLVLLISKFPSLRHLPPRVSVFEDSVQSSVQKVVICKIPSSRSKTTCQSMKFAQEKPMKMANYHGEWQIVTGN